MNETLLILLSNWLIWVTVVLGKHMSWWWILCKTSLPQGIRSICLGSHPPDPQKLGTNTAKRHLPHPPLRTGSLSLSYVLVCVIPNPSLSLSPLARLRLASRELCVVLWIVPSMNQSSSDLLPWQEEVEWSERITFSKWCIKSLPPKCIGMLAFPDTGKLRSHCLTAVLFLFLSCHLIYLQKVTAVFINNEIICQEDSSMVLGGSRVFCIWWAYRYSPPLSLPPLPQTFVWWWQN